MNFSKYEGLGNDYLVVRSDDFAGRLTPEKVRKICDRHFGIGSDGILVREKDPAAGRFQLKIFNPDGTEAEKSGNGLRIFSRYLWDQKCVAGDPFAVSTAGGEVTCQVKDGGRTVTVDMGTVRFDSEAIPVTGPAREVLREVMTVGGRTVELSAATVGNPHCVVLRDRVSEEEARSLGPLLECAPAFPNKTNVQFVEVLDRNNIRIEIWERGAGYTLASGSSSCAAASVAHRLGLCDGDVTVHMPGGELSIQIAPDFACRMTGPVVKVADGRLSEEIFAAPTSG